jgi:GntR family transcriptional regulator
MIKQIMATSKFKRTDPQGLRPEGSAAFSPLYRQIRQLLEQALQQGEWKPGEAIPSEFELARRFHVSQGTVRKAIDELASEHMLIRRQGKGTFVATHQEPVVRFRFLRLQPVAGQQVPGVSEILWCRKLRASADVAKALDVRAGDALVYIRRLLRFEGVPTLVDDIYLPAVLFKGLSANLLAENPGPLYGFFESHFGLSMVRAEECLRAVGAPADVAELLGVALSHPVLRVDRISYTYGDRAVELRYGHYLTDQYFYRNALN